MATLQASPMRASTLMMDNGMMSDPDDDERPTPPSKDRPDSAIKSPASVESFFNPMGLTRTNSLYTLSRASFTNQLSQLTSLNLPEASSLSESVSSIPTATAATRALSTAAIQIQRWIQKAAEVLAGLDAEDDVEWASAGGREGLGEVDTAIGKFEGLVEVYVTAIEQVQKREDISKVPKEELAAVVETMEIVMAAWENVRKLLRDVRQQVDLAMEWEELWNVVLGDIGLEMENLGRLVFEMEEKRHKALVVDFEADINMGLDIQELETIVEESPMGNNPVNRVNHRFSMPPAFPSSSPLQSPHVSTPHEDSNLLALIARMQPLRASLDFLPMRLSTFQSRAEGILPTACEELESRRTNLERRWKTLESDAEKIRQELGEDRWVVTFRRVGRQAQKMCESVERSVSKLQEALDSGIQHSNPAALAKRVEAYETKRTHYGQAIPRVLAIIDKGLKDRLTINGEILRLHTDIQAVWSALEAEIRDMDHALEYSNKNKGQQLRDSISTIVSNDQSAISSVGTPSSSPSSSVVMGPVNSKKGFPLTPDLDNVSQHSSTRSTSSGRPFAARRNISLPPENNGSPHLPRNPLMMRSVTMTPSTIRGASPSPNTKSSSGTPTPGARPQRPSVLGPDTRPRWNSSPRVDYKDIGHNFKPISPAKPASQTKSLYSYRNTRSYSNNTAKLPHLSPLSREQSASPAPSNSHLHNPRSRLTAGSRSSFAGHVRRHTSPSPARSAHGSQSSISVDTRPSRPTNTLPLHPKLTQSATASRRQSLLPHIHTALPPDERPGSAIEEESPSARPRMTRPATAMAGTSSRRISMLPVPKARAASGRESALEMRAGSRAGFRNSISTTNENH